MSQLSQIRSITQDVPVYQKEIITLDGTQVTFQCFYFPVLRSSVIITPSEAITSIDEQNGVITFTTAPNAGTYTLEYSHVLLLDAALQDFLDIEADGGDPADVDVRLGAANALDAIASSQALIQKKLKLLDLETDGPALAKALRDHANTLRKQVFSDDNVDSTFDIAEQINDSPSWKEKVVKDWMRQQ